jgi:hypothetical protein
MAYVAGRGRRASETYPEARASASGLAGKTKIDIAKFPAGLPGTAIKLPAPGARKGDSCTVVFGSDVQPASILILPHINVFDDNIQFHLADVDGEGSGWPGGPMTFAWAVFHTP